MTRMATGLCVAAAFGMVASLGAQTTGTTDQTRSHSSMSDQRNGDVTITGCLQKGADGNYILTNARVDSGMSGSMGSTGSMHGSTGTTTGSGTTAGTTGSTMSGTTSGSGSATGSTTATGATTTAGSEHGAMESGAMTWQLTGGKDLDKHVGHKIQVTGRAEGMSGSSKDEAYEHAGTATGTTATTAGTATGSTATTGTTATGSTAGTTGSTATGTTGTTAGEMQRSESTSSTATGHRLDVKSVKMVSTSCS